MVINDERWDEWLGGGMNGWEMGGWILMMGDGWLGDGLMEVDG